MAGNTLLKVLVATFLIVVTITLVVGIVYAPSSKVANNRAAANN